MKIVEKGKGKTLFELAIEALQKKEPAEFGIFNPLKARIGDFVKIDAEGVPSDAILGIVEIDAYKRVVRGTFQFTDYVLREGDTWVTVRVNPLANPDPRSQKHFCVLVLFPDTEMGFDENFLKILNSGEPLEVREGDKIIATYDRLVKDEKEPDDCTVTCMEDPGQSPKIEFIDSWAFIRDIGDNTPEFYFVEMNRSQGNIFQTFRGVEITESDVTIFPKVE